MNFNLSFMQENNKISLLFLNDFNFIMIKECDNYKLNLFINAN